MSETREIQNVNVHVLLNGVINLLEDFLFWSLAYHSHWRLQIHAQQEYKTAHILCNVTCNGRSDQGRDPILKESLFPFLIHCLVLQWNLSIADTLGTAESGEMSTF